MVIGFGHHGRCSELVSQQLSNTYAGNNDPGRMKTSHNYMGRAYGEPVARLDSSWPEARANTRCIKACAPSLWQNMLWHTADYAAGSPMCVKTSGNTCCCTACCTYKTLWYKLIGADLVWECTKFRMAWHCSDQAWTPARCVRPSGLSGCIPQHLQQQLFACLTLVTMVAHHLCGMGNKLMSTIRDLWVWQTMFQGSTMHACYIDTSWHNSVCGPCA
jgi:hypothetical protein